MDIYNISNANYHSAVYSSKNDGKVKDKENKDAEKEIEKALQKGFSEEAATYKPSKSDSVKDNSAIIAQMKKDTANRLAQMQELVKKLFLKQGQTFISTDEMIKSLANGKLEVDEETAKQAKEEISEDGYWGVEQTSDRILDFAKALSGGDEDKMKNMLEAFKKGYSQAGKAWGKELPSLCKDTYDAVIDKFDNFFKKDDDSKTETPSNTSAPADTVSPATVTE